MDIILISIGGAIGSLLRHFSYQIFNYLAKENELFTQFPYPTFFVNIAGSFLAGCLYFFILKNTNESNQILKNFLLVGFLGGFTTFSSFSLDFFRLFVATKYLQASLYAISSFGFAITFLFLGFYLCKAIF